MFAVPGGEPMTPSPALRQGVITLAEHEIVILNASRAT
jgi:hypothetical protein